jgi:hypothetical protein
VICLLAARRVPEGKKHGVIVVVDFGVRFGGRPHEDILRLTAPASLQGAHRMRVPATSRKLLRWSLIGVAPLAASMGYQLTSAAPHQAVTCEWRRLDSGEDRAQHALAFLPSQNAVIAFGGADLRAGSGSQIKDDVHRLDLAPNAPSPNWYELNVAGNPDDRMEHAMAVRSIPDGADEVITYGGIDRLPTGGGGGTFTWQSPLGAAGAVPLSIEGAHAPMRVINSANKLFSFNGSAAQWAAVGSAGQARTDHSMIWLPSDDAVVVFGGRRTEEASSAEDSVWTMALSGSAPQWTPVNAGQGPSKRFAHTAVYDDAGARMLVFGGTSDWDNAFNDVWALNLLTGTAGANWERIEPQGAPPRGRYDHVAVYVPPLEWMVVFGGLADVSNQLSDVYALDLKQSPPTWIKLNPEGAAPPALSGMAAAYAAETNTVVIQGGQVGADARDQTWGLVCASTAPTPTPTESSTDVPTGVATTPTPTTETPVTTVTPASATPTETGGTVTTPATTETPDTATPTQTAPVGVTSTPSDVATEPVGGWNLYLPMVRKDR